jgi:hypothetical protein
MGLFKSAILRTHAENISRGFGKVRSQHFDYIVRSVRNQLGPELVSSGIGLGGEADLALKGFQLWLYLAFSVMHPYVSGKQDSELSGNIVASLSGACRKQVESYFLKFNEYRNRYVDLVCQVAFPVAQTITPDLDPRSLTITAKLLPFLAINTQIVIADEFRDESTATRLDSQMKILYGRMERDEGETIFGPVMYCFNCGFSFKDESKCCALCGIPLMLVHPIANERSSPDSGTGQQTCQWNADSGPAPNLPKATPIPTDLPAEMIEKGIDFRRNHFRGISDWEERMFSEFGEKVVPLLGRIWNSTS